jgi:hypothetical protein
MTCRDAGPRPHRVIRTLAGPYSRKVSAFSSEFLVPSPWRNSRSASYAECVFATLGPAGRLPQLVGAGADLLNGRDAHLRTHKPSWPKSQRGLPQLVPLRTRTSGSFAR